ncbi:hypothetical protein [Nostoc sp. GT001]|uniref:hypothetical protein n=1 Tax=Nostoc sp. GT001 TaxID=3056647 RepID=UPI0025AAFF4C|nr:hypothetical protein [Nostoc sp. GT001]MDM9582314.1 hypothetical protein [Nostoc sp. GT001]
MTDAINPRQFASLDYADADMYGALLERPATGTPLERPQPIVLTGRENASERQMEKRLWDEEWKRTEAARTARKNAEAAREAEILGRNASQRQAIANRVKGTDAPELLPPKSESPLAQLQRSTPERQPLPSTGSPPPTIGGTSVRADALVEPTATPRPAAIREAIGNTVGGIGQSLPKSLPQAAGRLIVPGVGAGLTFAGALIAGQSVQQAAATAAVVTAGSVAGGLVGTAVGGLIGGYVGSMIGGFAGGYLANALFPQQLPSTAAKHEQYTPNYQPYIGGQGIGISYYVFWSMKLGNGTVSNFQSAPISGAITAFKTTRLSDGRWQVEIFSNDVSTGASVVGNATTSEPYVTSISRADGQRDTAPDRRGYNPAPADNTPPQYSYSPIGGDNTIPSGLPTAGLNKGKDKQIAPSMPSNNTPNGAPGFVGHGGLAPSYLPNPEHQPSNGGGMLPQMQPLPQRQPLPFAEPEDIAVPRITPMLSSGEASTATNPSTFAHPAYVPETAKPIPISDALSPVPKAKSAPIAKTPTETALDQQKKDFEEQIGRITAIATAIAALTPAIQGLPDAIASNPNVRAANRDDVQGAVCEISQPTGCLGAPIKQAEDAAKANGTKLDEINAALGAGNAGANAALLAGQQTILERLGDQLPGGIGGKLSRFADWMHLDRVLNIMILAATVHNALMLSNDIGQTLIGAINNVLQFIGLKKEDGSAFDIGSIISGSIENLIKGAIGSENYQELTTAWAKANRIYQATINIANSFTNIGHTITNALEVVGGMQGKIGNALRIWGVVGEKAYQWFNPQPNYHSRMLSFFENAQQGASTIQMVTQAPIDIVNAVTEFNNSTTELAKAVKEDPEVSNRGVEIQDAQQTKVAQEEIKTVSQGVLTGLSDVFNANE